MAMIINLKGGLSSTVKGEALGTIGVPNSEERRLPAPLFGEFVASFRSERLIPVANRKLF